MAALKKALSEAEDKAAKERAEREKQEARVGEVQQELQDFVKKYESLERDSKTQGSELAKALENAQNAKAEVQKAEVQKALQEIQPVKKIAAGKAFIMESKHVKETFLLLTRVRSSPGAFADLPRSVSDAAEFYRAEEGSSTKKLFWSQYTRTEHPMPLSDQLKQLVELHKAAEQAMSDAAEFYRAEEGSSTKKLFWSQYTRTEHPMPLSDQLKQLVELHKAAEQAMKGLIVRMWPGEPLPGSYFGLVRRLVNACPWFEVIKRSVCIEGARRAFARAKVHWAKMDAEKLVKEGPP